MTEYLNIDMNIHEYVLDRYYETVFLDIDRLQSYTRLVTKVMTLNLCRLWFGWKIQNVSFQHDALFRFYEWPSTDCCLHTYQGVCVYYPDCEIVNKGGGWSPEGMELLPHLAEREIAKKLGPCPISCWFVHPGLNYYTSRGILYF